MVTFLDQLISELLKSNPQQFADTCIVFPTRRACIIFKKKLIAKIGKASWLPATFAISDFIAEASPYRIADRVELLLLLYPVYKKHYKDTNYSKFIGWGEMMLKDFDELDRYLVNTHVLFAGLKQLKEIDAEFQFSEEEENFYSGFWKNFSDRELSSTKASFLQTWKTLPEIYNEYQKTLVAKKINYEGNVYRLLCESPDKYFSALPFSNFNFAGFYALSNAEEKIIEYFIEQKNAKVFWDADEYYYNNSKQEAGTFLRNSKLVKSNFNWNGKYFEEIEKKIQLAGTVGNTALAKYTGALVENLLKEDKFSEDETAIVLPDESMLMPVLQNLPDGISHLNITMGFPLSNHSLNSFINVLTKFQESVIVKKEKIGFITQHVKDILLNPVTQQSAPDCCYHLLRFFDKYRNSFVYADLLFEQLNEIKSDTVEKEFIKLIFTNPNDAEEVLIHFDKILQFISTYQKNKSQHTLNHYLIVSHVHKSYRDFSKLITGDISTTDIETLRHLIKDFFYSLKIPFSGEPVKGLQLMGFLETRVLDFKTLIITNVSENTLPSSSIKSSFIPYTIRKAFKLPTYEDQDAIYAYHFYRLLQRAEHIYLLYNTEVNSSAGGEISRFILQLAYELEKKFPTNISISHANISNSIKVYTDNTINVPTTEKLKNKLINLFAYSGAVEPKKRFSPSAINTYIYCPFKFYLNYVEGIKEENDFSEIMEANDFGNVLHKTLELLYAPFLAQEISPENISSLFPQIEKTVSAAIISDFDKYFNKEGSNYLFEKILIELTNKVLAQDKKYARFTMLHIEKEFFTPFKINNQLTVKLFGKFDRVDLKENKLRILDYKSGNAELSKTLLPEDLFTETNNKINVQLLIYNLIAKSFFSAYEIYCGVVSMRNLGDGIKFLNNNNPVTGDELESFEIRLKDFIGNLILQPNFRQTTDIKKCANCGYKNICNR